MFRLVSAVRGLGTRAVRRATAVADRAAPLRGSPRRLFCISQARFLSPDSNDAVPDVSGDPNRYGSLDEAQSVKRFFFFYETRLNRRTESDTHRSRAAPDTLPSRSSRRRAPRSSSWSLSAFLSGKSGSGGDGPLLFLFLCEDFLQEHFPRRCVEQVEPLHGITFALFYTAGVVHAKELVRNTHSASSLVRER